MTSASCILPGFSTLIISAPRSPRSIVANGPARTLFKQKITALILFLNNCIPGTFIHVIKVQNTKNKPDPHYLPVITKYHIKSYVFK